MINLIKHLEKQDCYRFLLSMMLFLYVFALSTAASASEYSWAVYNKDESMSLVQGYFKTAHYGDYASEITLHNLAPLQSSKTVTANDGSFTSFFEWTVSDMMDSNNHHYPAFYCNADISGDETDQVTIYGGNSYFRYVDISGNTDCRIDLTIDQNFSPKISNISNQEPEFDTDKNMIDKSHRDIPNSHYPYEWYVQNNSPLAIIGYCAGSNSDSSHAMDFYVLPGEKSPIAHGDYYTTDPDYWECNFQDRSHQMKTYYIPRTKCSVEANDIGTGNYIYLSIEGNKNGLTDVVIKTPASNSCTVPLIS